MDMDTALEVEAVTATILEELATRMIMVGEGEVMAAATFRGVSNMTMDLALEEWEADTILEEEEDMDMVTITD